MEEPPDNVVPLNRNVSKRQFKPKTGDEPGEVIQGPWAAKEEEDPLEAQGYTRGDKMSFEDWHAYKEREKVTLDWLNKREAKRHEEYRKKNIKLVPPTSD